MSFIRDNIVKIIFGLIALVIVVVIVVSCSNKKTVVSDDTGYLEMENQLQNAAIRLTKKNKAILPKVTNNTKKIQINTLIENNLLNEFHAVEDRNVKCTGYVEIIKKYDDREDYRYTPYIKCGKYYETKTISEYIIANEPVVADGQGLIKQEVQKEEQNIQIKDDNSNSPVENQKYYSYYYKGEYPNNYIILGDRLYRIIEITEDGNLKVISTRSTSSSYVWDNRFNSEKQRYIGINDFDKSRLKDNLEFIYSNNNEENGEVFFSDIERDYIVEHEFCIGKRSENEKLISSQYECTEKENLRVGLISIADYYRVSTSTGCTNVGKNECNNYNYLFSLDNGRNIVLSTLTGSKDDTYSVFVINYGELSIKNANSGRRLYPVIYLDKNILYKSGDGSYKNPYIVR